METPRLMETLAPFRPYQQDFRWQGVPSMPYKDDGTAPFKDISRQNLFDDPALACQLRYFEMAADGYSTLERHEHAHAVMILRGTGECLLGTEVRAVKQFDLVHIPAWTWHQFRATGGVPMGFLCMVNQDRDRPQLPGPSEVAALRAHPALAAFLQATGLREEIPAK